MSPDARHGRGARAEEAVGGGRAGAPFQPGFKRVERLKLALKRVAAFEFEDAGFDLHAVFVVVERAG
jgi:hypothetical protein